MVNAEMFKGAFDFRPQQQPVPAQQYVPQPAPAPAPAYYSAPSQPVDPEVDKFRKLMLKWLSIIVGGSAILLIVWRVILKFL